jgi:hypothetical protein
MRILLTPFVLACMATSLPAANPMREPLMADHRAEERQYEREELRARAIRRFCQNAEYERRQMQKSWALWMACPDIQVLRLCLVNRRDFNRRNFAGNVIGLQVPGMFVPEQRVSLYQRFLDLLAGP